MSLSDSQTDIFIINAQPKLWTLATWNFQHTFKLLILRSEMGKNQKKYLWFWRNKIFLGNHGDTDIKKRRQFNDVNATTTCNEKIKCYISTTTMNVLIFCAGESVANILCFHTPTWWEFERKRRIRGNTQSNDLRNNYEPFEGILLAGDFHKRCQ